ncbi:DoxX family protein [Streptomyces sp. LX-29]|uniref:DoxX family protein n=1 Tax=Streptomyces sp. LX-29 TaxID=2900152 RepID=UPI00240E5CCA|nr:DoxX family protein [Streptomyces sp. LX-29]WFB08361.1 DoxX family protein [Streptomyces sp. LX-29]
MSTTYVVITVLAAVMSGFSAGSIFFNAPWVVQPMIDYRVPRGWWTWLGIAKAAGAIGLLVGLAIPLIGVLAAIGLILYFTGAAITVARARWYSHIAFPLVYMAPAAASLILGLTS